MIVSTASGVGPSVCARAIGQLQGCSAQRRGSQARHFGRLPDLHSDHCRRLLPVLNATESSQSSAQSPQEVESELRDAVRLEQYGRAAELRDLLKSLQPQNTAPELKKRLDKLVADEQYEVKAAARK